MEDDLAKGLEKIFATKLTGAPEKPPEPGAAVPAAPAAPAPPAAAPASLKELGAAATDHYNKAIDAQRRGDWATYGSELKALEDTLKQMQVASG